MSKKALLIIFSFAVVIEVIAIFLFFITQPTADTFLAIIVSFVLAIITSNFALFSYKRACYEEDGQILKIKLFLILYNVILFIPFLIRVIILLAKL